MTIENGFVPKTPTEVALIERIAELKRKLWEGARCYNTVDGFPADPNDNVLSVQRIDTVLHLAARADAKMDPRGLRIEARTHGPLSLGVANYMTRDQIMQINPFIEADMLAKLHEQVVRSVGKMILEKFREGEAA